MSETVPSRPSESLLHSELLFRVLGGDAMQILRCGICMEFFDVPIVLPCGHTFCLHCLTEMCKHASRNCVLSPLKDLRIGCPNCRVLIYASPILERNVTCNFIIQSLIECLRVREGGTKLSIGVNTEEVRVGPKIRAVSDVEMERVIKEVDRMTEALGKHNVLDSAYFEVEEIRKNHLAQEAKRQDDEKQKAWNQQRTAPQFSSHLRLHQQQPFFQQQQQQQHQQQRPRTLSWEPINNQVLIMTPSSSSSCQQQQQQQLQPNLPPNFKFQHQLQLMAAQQPATQFQFKPQTQPQQPQPQQYRQTQQQQQQHAQSTLSRLSKMATVLPLKRCPDVSQFSGTMGQLAGPSSLSTSISLSDPAPGHHSRLDNDPAVMSYSYKAASNHMAGNK